MKKLLAFVLALLMALSLAACGAGEKETDGDAATPPATDGSEALTDGAEKENSESVTPPKSDGSENLTDEDPNSGIPVPFVAAKPVSLYPIYDGYGDYEKKVTVIHSVEELTQYLEAINALAAENKSPIDDTECVYGKELLQTYDSVYFAEKVLWLIVQDVSGSPGVSVTDICKQTDEKGKVSYTVTVEYIWNASGAISDDAGTSKLFILETAAEEDMRQDNIRVYKMHKDE